MYRAALLCFLCSVTLSAVVEAQSVRGRLVADGSHLPIASASIALIDVRGNVIAQTVTDSTGSFRFRPGAGHYQVHASMIGYKAATSPPIELEQLSEIEVRIVLSPDVVLLAPLEITARYRPLLTGELIKGFEDRRLKGIGFAITREDIEQRHARSVTDLLRMVPGVRIEWRFGGSSVMIAGAAGSRLQGDCPPRVILDGMEYRWGGNTIDDIPTYDIEAIEVFRGIAEMPAELAGPESRCGVIAVWTRRGKD